MRKAQQLIEPGEVGIAIDSGIDYGLRLLALEFVEFSNRSQMFWVLQTGAGGAILIAALLGFVVGFVVVSQNMYAMTMEKLDSGWTITAVHLDVAARVPNADKAVFDKAAANAKSGCPVSKVLNANITMDAKLEG